ncbi:GntR family transcriptional regulator [Wenjunlia tyrosinilytica]|uniref:GntR family transcriptional regulator n=1 Tax=Wenjunlia tyrosinilytica TaxID=1544741 RepID=A0A917ZIR7_9ACTN|nr:GntR family transcriptional regulator [Wenjunlia tyrosinilytica]GGO84060.1 GntR family transcriptional regulator [Wenjunlia tyrosinilytica]
MGTTQLAAQEPKYWHLKTILNDALDSDFAVGEILPNERELAARFGVARATLRQALDQLELEGRLQRRRGVGTTVAGPRMGVPVARPEHCWPGSAPDAWRTVECAEAPAPAAVAEALGIAADEPVHTLRRLRMMHGQPVGTEILYIPGATVPGVPGFFAAGGRARAVLRELQSLELDGESRSVELGVAGAEDAKQLERLPGSPVLVVSTRYRSGGATAAVSVSTYRADTCRLTFDDSGSVDVSPYGSERQAS